MKTLITLLTISNLLVGCQAEIKNEDEPVKRSINEQQLVQGKIDGAPWTFVSGYAKKSQVNPERIYIDLWNLPEKDQCPAFANNSDSLFSPLTEELEYQLMAEAVGAVFILVPMAVGEYQVSLNSLPTYYSQTSGSNKIGGAGIIKINSIGDFIEGGIQASYDDQNSVDGTFKVPFCKD